MKSFSKRLSGWVALTLFAASAISCVGPEEKDATLVSLLLGPYPAAVCVSGTLSLTATGQLSDGTEEDYTDLVEWVSDHPSIADFDPSQPGLVRGVSAGVASITAVDPETGVSASIQVYVEPAPPQPYAAILPGNASLAPGDSLQFQLVIVNPDGTQTDLTEQAAWSLDGQTHELSVSNAAGSRGLVTAGPHHPGNGVATVRAAAGDYEATVELRRVCGAWEAENYSGGSGTSADPYLICSPFDLMNISENAGDGAHFLQIGDIDLSILPHAFPGLQPFNGIYDGSRREIRGLKVRGAAVGAWALFRTLTSGAVVRGVRLVNVDVQGPHTVGALAGYSEGDVLIEDSQVLGGTVTSDGGSTGGLIGFHFNGTLTIRRCATVVDISAGNVAVGGIIGDHFNTAPVIIEDTFSRSNLLMSQVYSGGIIGYSAGNLTLRRVYASGRVAYVNGLVGGIGGQVTGSTAIESVYWNTETVDSGIERAGMGDLYDVPGQTSAQLADEATFVGWDFSTVWMITPEGPELR